MIIWIKFVVIVLLSDDLLSVKCLFERENYRVDLQSNAVFPLQSRCHVRGTSTRVAFVGQSGDRLSLVCNIDFSTGCFRSTFFNTNIFRRGQCCDDYFYVGFNLHPKIRGAQYFCGRKTIRKNSRKTSGRPVLVIATSATRFGRFGKYKCFISSTTGPTTTTATTTTTTTTTTVDSASSSDD